MTKTYTSEQKVAALQLVSAIADCIMELGEVPSGHLYANVMGKIDLETYQGVIDILVLAKLITVSPSHLIKWNGAKIKKDS